jgi:hypothetical protein
MEHSQVVLSTGSFEIVVEEVAPLRCAVVIEDGDLRVEGVVDEPRITIATARLRRRPEGGETLEPFRWAGEGRVRVTGDGKVSIEDCSANLSERLYERLQVALEEACR